MPNKVKRKSSVRRNFLKSKGSTKTSRGKEVAHKNPLILGGKDHLRNLTLKKKSVHKIETKKLFRKIQNR